MAKRKKREYRRCPCGRYNFSDIPARVFCDCDCPLLSAITNAGWQAFLDGKWDQWAFRRWLEYDVANNPNDRPWEAA